MLRTVTKTPETVRVPYTPDRPGENTFTSPTYVSVVRTVQNSKANFRHQVPQSSRRWGESWKGSLVANLSALAFEAYYGSKFNSFPCHFNAVFGLLFNSKLLHRAV